MGERRYSSCSFLTSALDGVSGQHHALAALYPRGKDPRYPLYRRLGGPQSRSGHRLEEKSSAFVGDRTPVVQSVVRHYTDWATPAPKKTTLIYFIFSGSKELYITNMFLLKKHSASHSSFGTFTASHSSKNAVCLPGHIGFHHDSAPSHAELLVKRLLARKKTSVLKHPPYSPDFAPNKLLTFLKLKYHWNKLKLNRKMTPSNVFRHGRDFEMRV
jgi:hypothetical protein